MEKNSEINPILFYDELCKILKPKDASDRTCIRRVTFWLDKLVKSGREHEIIYKRVLTLAKDASLPCSRNPRAVFMYLLKNEMGYDKSRE